MLLDYPTPPSKQYDSFLEEKAGDFDFSQTNDDKNKEAENEKTEC